MCGGLAAAHFYSAGNGSGESSAAESTDEYEGTVLLQKDEAEVEKVSVTNAGGGFEADAGDGDLLEIADLAGLPMDETELESLRKYAAYIRSQDTVADGADRLADFGLDQPEASVKISYTDGTSAEFSIGSEVPSASTASRYVLWDGTVHVMYELHVSPFLQSEDDYLSKQVTPVYNSDDPNYQVTYLSVSGTGREQPLTIEQTGTTDYGQGVQLSNYEITSPVEGNFDLSKEDYLTSVFGITADSVAVVRPEEADTERCGLSDPYAVVDVKYQDLETDEETEIRFSSSEPDENGKMYIAVDGTDLIYECTKQSNSSSSQDTSAVTGEEAPSGLTWLDAAAEDLLARTVVTPYMNTVSEILIETPDLSSDILISVDDSGNASAEIDGEKVADQDNFNNFYYVLISQEALSLLTDEEKAQTDVSGMKCLATITFRYRDGSADDVISWYGESEDSRNLVVTLNGQPGYRFSYTSLELILKDLEMVKNGEEITVRY